MAHLVESGKAASKCFAGIDSKPRAASNNDNFHHVF